jgi:hypothetical protein
MFSQIRLLAYVVCSGAGFCSPPMTEREERSMSMILLKMGEGAEANYPTTCSAFF